MPASTQDFPTFIATDGRYAGLPCYRFPNGKVLPVVSGGLDDTAGAGGADGGSGDAGDGGQGAGAAGGADGGATGSDGSGSAEVKFTPEQQAKIDEIVAGRVAETKRTTAQATAAELAKQLGCTIDEAKAHIAAAKKHADDEADEATKRAAAEAERDAATAAQKATTRDANIRIAVADATAGLAESEKDDAKRAKIRADIAVLVANELGDNDDPSTEDIATALKSVKDLHEAMFATKKGASGDHSGGPRGDGSGAPTGIEAGRARAKAEKERESKQPEFLGGLQPLGASRASA